MSSSISTPNTQLDTPTNIPQLKITYPDLPVTQQREEILAAIAKHQVVVIAGETGSGKTTQLPKICLELGLGQEGLIGHTQPRRMAAVSVAKRLAEELQQPLGQNVGYQIRFQDFTSENCLVKLMTDGILLAETQQDPLLKKYQAIIIDEAHERSLNIDFLLGYLKRLLPKRPDLKLIITSATLDVESFAKHFNACPVIEVSGRTYPVDIYYQPLIGSDSENSSNEKASSANDKALSLNEKALSANDDSLLQQGIAEALQTILKEEKERGWGRSARDVLIFLPGEREIRQTAKYLRQVVASKALNNLEILPLYARLPAKEQQKIFASSYRLRRVILATNVAETSLTLPGIRYVIDPGLARISRFSASAGIQRLPIEAISQASANQRAGRCGRIAPGLCIRLYSEEDFIARAEFTPPEILRTNLAAVILQMLALRLGKLEDFPFLQAPEGRSIRAGLRQLFELGAVTSNNRLTPLGKQLARLPLDPRLARMLLAANDNGCLSEVLVLTSALSLQDPRERPAEQQAAADQAHAQWADRSSDFLALLNLWYAYEEQRINLSNRQLREYCQKNFLNAQRMREWRATHHQLKILCRQLGLKLNKLTAAQQGITEDASQEAAKPQHNSQAIHQAVLAGLLTNIGMLQENKEFLAPRGRKFFIHPSSRLAKKPPKWVMAAELVETSRLFARLVARIEPEWLEPLARHLIKTTYSQPHWQKRQARVAAHAKLSLFGLPIINERRVDYAKIDPEVCHDIFIRSGLVEGLYVSRAAFMQHNQRLLEEVEGLEDKARKKDILVDDEVLYSFYAEKIPEHICRGVNFEHWRKQAEKKDPKLLFLTQEFLLARNASEVTQDSYPDVLYWEGISWQLSYNFDPSAKDDGVSVQVPLALLKQVPEARLTWLVDGLLEEKCLSLMRGLPKQLRKNFVPLPNYIQAALEALIPSEQPLTQVLAEFFTRKTGVKLTAEDLEASELAPHLRINYRLLDKKGKLLAQGRDLAKLQQEFDAASQAATQSLATSDLQVSGVTSWTFASLPIKKTTKQAGLSVTSYPALIDEAAVQDKKPAQNKDATLGVKLFATPEEAAANHHKGTLRLLALELKEVTSYALSQVKDLSKLHLLFSQIGSPAELEADLIAASLEETYLQPLLAANQPLPRDAEAFNQLLKQHKAEVVPAILAKAEVARQALAERQPLAATLKGKINFSLALTYQAAASQLEGLFYVGFIQDAGDWLAHYPRFLQALAIRLEKAPRQLGLERQYQQELNELTTSWRNKVKQQEAKGWVSEELKEVFWLIEELRVSLFAQQLKTSQKVSAKRINSLLAEM